MKYIKRISTIIVLVALLSGLGTNPLGFAQTGLWTPPFNISNTPHASWFPDLVIDDMGNVHVVWCETVRPDTGTLKESVYYTVWNGYEWSEPNDLIPENPDINRHALAIDKLGNLYLTFRYKVTGGIGTTFTWAPAGRAWSAASWSTPHRLDVNGNSYMSDLAMDDQEVLHFIFDDRGDPESEICLGGCADIYYRRSEDKGRTWSYPVNLSHSPVGTSREQIEIDSSGTIHITWDNGWDRLSGGGEPTSGSYTFSMDGGRTWSHVISVTYPDLTVAQLTVGSDGQGGVMLVWRATSRNEIFYQWSTDGGHSWGAPSTIPEIFSRPWTNPFDMYDMAADSAGHIHLVVVGRRVQDSDAPLGVYHLEWNGKAWSDAERIYGEMGFPEYPKIVVSRGNQLHVAWFVRESQWGDPDAGPHQVWYSSGQSTAPHQVVTPLPTATSMSPTFTPPFTPTPIATAYPTLSLDDVGLPNGLKTESDDVVRLAIALSPVALLVLVVMAVRMGWFGKLRR
jgi:hypothetical protein